MSYGDKRKRCEQCGVHPAGYIASGDGGDTDYCACCYGEPYDDPGNECETEPVRCEECEVGGSDQ